MIQKWSKNLPRKFDEIIKRDFMNTMIKNYLYKNYLECNERNVIKYMIAAFVLQFFLLLTPFNTKQLNFKGKTMVFLMYIISIFFLVMMAYCSQKEGQKIKWSDLCRGLLTLCWTIFCMLYVIFFWIVIVIDDLSTINTKFVVGAIVSSVFLIIAISHIVNGIVPYAIILVKMFKDLRYKLSGFDFDKKTRIEKICIRVTSVIGILLKMMIGIAIICFIPMNIKNFFSIDFIEKVLGVIGNFL